MVCPQSFYDALTKAGVTFFAGVPDSLLKPLCACITEQAVGQHVITANEGGAVAMAMGSYLASGKLPCVYLQNSGLGNALNPLLSMADIDVYGLPLLLLIGWRGELDATYQQLPDEPQHKKQGKVTLSLLDAMQIPYQVIGSDTQDIPGLVQSMVQLALERTSPVACVIRKKYVLSLPCPFAKATCI